MPKIAPQFWSGERSDGVDTVHVEFNGEPIAALSHLSLYWVYRESNPGWWVIGGGNVGPTYAGVMHELVVEYDRHWFRDVLFMPDLRWEDVKLGWWRHGCGTLYGVRPTGW